MTNKLNYLLLLFLGMLLYTTKASARTQKYDFDTLVNDQKIRLELTPDDMLTITLDSQHIAVVAKGFSEQNPFSNKPLLCIENSSKFYRSSLFIRDSILFVGMTNSQGTASLYLFSVRKTGLKQLNLNGNNNCVTNNSSTIVILMQNGNVITNTGFLAEFKKGRMLDCRYISQYIVQKNGVLFLKTTTLYKNKKTKGFYYLDDDADYMSMLHYLKYI